MAVGGNRHGSAAAGSPDVSAGGLQPLDDFRVIPLKTAAGGGIAIGPVLLGAARPAHILTPSATVRRIVNMTALAVADAQDSPPRR